MKETELDSTDRAKRRYFRSDKGKRAQRKYSDTEAGKETQSKYISSEKGKAAQLRYYYSEKGKQAQERKTQRRQLVRALAVFLEENPDKTVEDFLTLLKEAPNK